MNLDLACKNYYNYRNVYCNKLLKASIYNKNYKINKFGYVIMRKMTPANRYRSIHLPSPCQVHAIRYIKNTELARELICAWSLVVPGTVKIEKKLLRIKLLRLNH